MADTSHPVAMSITTDYAATARILGLSFAMFLGAFVAGYIPTKLSVSARQLRYISIFGAGLLVSSALVIIIPVRLALPYEASSNLRMDSSSQEGIHTIYANESHLPAGPHTLSVTVNPGIRSAPVIEPVAGNVALQENVRRPISRAELIGSARVAPETTHDHHDSDEKAFGHAFQQVRTVCLRVCFLS